MDNIEASYEPDTQKTEKYKKNYLFCRFHHLFEYEATYYSYLIAKLSSRKLFSEGLAQRPGSGGFYTGRGDADLSQREVSLIFGKAGETSHYERTELLKF